MIVKKTYADLVAPLTDEERAELEALKDSEPEPDEDCPAQTAEQLKQFRRVADEYRNEKNKQSVTLRLSPATLAKAKSLGKGYTSILSRIIENALNDPDTLRNSL